MSADASAGNFACIFAASLFHSCASKICHPSSSIPLHVSLSIVRTPCLAVPCTCSRTASDRIYSRRWREIRALLCQVPRARARVHRLRFSVGDRTVPRKACRIACCMPCRSSDGSRGDPLVLICVFRFPSVAVAECCRQAMPRAARPPAAQRPCQWLLPSLAQMRRGAI